MKPKSREVKIKETHFLIHTFKKVNLNKEQTSNKQLGMISDLSVDISSTEL